MKNNLTMPSSSVLIFFDTTLFLCLPQLTASSSNFFIFIPV